MKEQPKELAVLKFNLDLFARPVKIYHNDEVKDLSQAKEVLRKFMLVK